MSKPVKRMYKNAMFRGIEFLDLLDKPTEEIVKMFRARQRRRYARGIHPKYQRLVKKCVAAKANQVEGEKPIGVKTHLRNCIIVPEMVGSVVEVYGGKIFHPVEVKPDMVGHYLAEFSMSYKPVAHGKLGVGATRSSKFTATT